MAAPGCGAARRGGLRPPAIGRAARYTFPPQRTVGRGNRAMPSAEPLLHDDRARLSTRVFHPERSPRARHNAPLFLAFVLIVLFASPDMESRLIFMAFALLFFGLYAWFIRRDDLQRVHVLELGPDGLRHAPLRETCGTDTLPWSAIRSLGIFVGTGAHPPAPRWLTITLEDSALRRQVSTPALARLAGGDVNILLAFDARPEAILAAARAFHERRASGGVAGPGV